MTWKIRHEGSPRSVEGLTLPQVLEGLQDGLWEPTDEVQGPDDPDWVAIENHPQLAEAAADLEPPPPRTYDDETRLDMNALIDVCMVLLVFFILTTSYAALQKRLKLPNVTGGEAGIATITDKDVAEQMVHVVIKMEDGKPVFLVEKKPVPEERLLAELKGFANKTSRNRLLLEYDEDVPWGAVVAVQDAAQMAEMDRVLWLVPDAELKR
jgi:biopolymer transport protein ExbD